MFVDGDGSGAFESAFEYARRAVSAATDLTDLVTRLEPYDGAVAVQAASLLRVRDPAAFEENVRAMIRVAPPHVAKGLRSYLEAWTESQARRADRTGIRDGAAPRAWVIHCARFRQSPHDPPLQAPADGRQNMTAAHDNADVSSMDTRPPGVAPIGQSRSQHQGGAPMTRYSSAFVIAMLSALLSACGPSSDEASCSRRKSRNPKSAC